MGFAIYSFSLIAMTACVLSIILRILRGRRNNIVFYTESFWLINIMGILFSVLLSVFYYRNDNESTIFFTVMTALFSLSNIAFYNGIVVFEEDSFFVRSLLGYKKYYSYSDVTGFMLKSRRYRHKTETKAIFYAGNKKFSVYTSSYNYPIFFEKLNSEHKKYNRGRNLPLLKTKP